MSPFTLSLSQRKPTGPAPETKPHTPENNVDFTLGTGYRHGGQVLTQSVDSDDFYVRQTTLASLLHPPTAAPNTADSAFRPREMTLGGLMGGGGGPGGQGRGGAEGDGAQGGYGHYGHGHYGDDGGQAGSRWPAGRASQAGRHPGHPGPQVAAAPAAARPLRQLPDLPCQTVPSSSGMYAQYAQVGQPHRLPAMHTRGLALPPEATPPLSPATPTRGSSGTSGASGSHSVPVTPRGSGSDDYAARYECRTLPFSVPPDAVEQMEVSESPSVSPSISPSLPPLPTEVETPVRLRPSPELPSGPQAYSEKAPSPPSKPPASAELPLPLSLSPLSFSPPLPPPPAQLPAPSSPPLPPIPALLARPSRPSAQPKAALAESSKKAIQGTFYFDPCLANKLFHVPQALSTTTDAALAGLSAYDDGSFNWITGAPINGIAKLAKGYLVPADAQFSAENGGVSLRIGVVDESGSGVETATPESDEGEPSASASAQGPGPGMKQKKNKSKSTSTSTSTSKLARTIARVAVSTNRGGVEIEILEIDTNRQLDLTVTTAAGDVLILLPDTFLGSVNVTSPEAPHWGPALAPAMERVKTTTTSVTMYTTAVIPQATRAAAAAAQKAAAEAKGGATGRNAVARMAGWSKLATTRANTSTAANSIKEYGGSRMAEYVPLPAPVAAAQDMLAPFSPVMRTGYASFTRTSRSKISVVTNKGVVLVGYRGTTDREAVGELGMRVGAGSKPKNWFKSTF